MIKLEFTEEDKRLLSYGRFNHPHPRVQLKMEVLSCCKIFVDYI
jgi:hypothetical protein